MYAAKAKATLRLCRAGGAGEGAEIHQARRNRAVYIPQRMIISFSMSMLLALFALMFLNVSMTHLESLIDRGWSALKAKEEMVTSRLGTVLSVSEQRALDRLSRGVSVLANNELSTDALGLSGANFDPSVLNQQLGILKGVTNSSELFDGLDDPLVQDAVKRLGAGAEEEAQRVVSNVNNLLALSPSIQEAASSAESTLNTAREITDVVNAVMSAGGLSEFDSFKDQVKEHMHLATQVAGYMAFIIVLFAWWSMFTRYRNQVIRARRGDYSMYWAKNKISRAVNYIGLQSALSTIGFVFFWFPWFVVVFVFSWKAAVIVILAFAIKAALASVSVTLLIVILQKLVMDCWLARGNVVRNKRVFMLADVGFTFFNLFKGKALQLVLCVAAAPGLLL